MSPPPSALPLFPTAEDVALREQAGELSRALGPDYFQALAGTGKPATEQWASLAAAGLLGIHLPAEYGGGGRGLSELAAVVEETAAAGVPAMPVLFSPGVNGTVLAQHGTPEQKERWLRGIATGATTCAFAMTEPDVGANSFEITTRAVRDGQDWLITGTKYYITGVDVADHVLVLARTGTDERTGRTALTLFMLETDSPGLSFSPLPTALQVPEQYSRLQLDAVRATPDRVIGAQGRGLQTAFAGMNAERILVAAISTGIGRYALAKAVAYAQRRTVWKNQPIGSHQAVSHPLAEARIAIEAARLMTQKACLVYDLGQDPGEVANMAKFLAVDAGLAALDAAIQTHGGNGVALEYQLSNYWFLMRVLKIGPVSREMTLNFVAEHTLGLPRSY